MKLETGRRQSGWRRRLLVAGLVLLAGVAVGSAQAPVAADNILARLEARRNLLGDLKIPCTHRRESALFSRPRERAGVFYYGREKGIVLHYTRPDEYAILLVGDRVQLVQPQAEIMDLDASRIPAMSGMLQVMRLNLAALGRFFEVRAASATNGMVRMTLVPRDGRGLAGLDLELAEDSGLLRRLAIRETSADLQVIEFMAAEPVELNERLFRADYWRSILHHPANPHDPQP